MGWLKSLLQEIIDKIDEDQLEVPSKEDLEFISMIIHRPETMGREAAAKFLGLSLSKFHELRDRGEIPEPRKRKGFKEKEYYLTDLLVCRERLAEKKK
ncbi:MAG: hypothetical protein ACOH2V_00745 [Candidatus Saccharimonadaceae bacterium]